MSEWEEALADFRRYAANYWELIEPPEKDLLRLHDWDKCAAGLMSRDVEYYLDLLQRARSVEPRGRPFDEWWERWIPVAELYDPNTNEDLGLPLRKLIFAPTRRLDSLI